MRTRVSLALIACIFLGLGGIAQAQVGIGRYERLQIAAHNLEETARALRFRVERQFPRYRSDQQAVLSLHRLHNTAARFQDQVARNIDDPQDVRRAYQRLLFAVSDAEFALRRSYQYSHLAYDFREVTRNMNQIQRLMPRVVNRYDDDRYDDHYDPDDDFDYDDDYDR